TPLIARRSIPSITSTTNRARCFSGSHSSTDGGRRNPVWRSIVRKLFIGATFVAMENHRTDSIPNDSYPVKSDRLLEAGVSPNIAYRIATLNPATFRRRDEDLGAVAPGRIANVNVLSSLDHPFPKFVVCRGRSRHVRAV